MSERRGFVSLNAVERARVDEVERIAKRGAACVPDLIAKLTDPSWSVRRVVVAVLSKLGEPAAVALCDALVTRRDDETRIAAACDALVASNADVDALLTSVIAKEPAAALLCDVASVLGRRRSANSVTALATLAQHADDNVAMAALEALGRVGGDVAIDMLVAAVTSKNFFRSFPALDVLGRSASPRAVEPLSALLGEPHYAVEAARALGRSGQLGAVRPLAAQLARPNDAQVRAAAVGIAEIHDRHNERFGTSLAVLDAVRACDVAAAGRRIVHCLGGADPGEQRAMCRVLGWIGGESAAFGLIELLDGDVSAASAAAEALTSLGPGAERSLAEALRHSDSQRRSLLLPLLGARSAAKDDVLACLADSLPSVRALACDTLARIGDVSVVPILFPLLADADARVSQGAAAAIQSLGSADTERLALEAARSSDVRVRRAALRIIAYFGYPSARALLIGAMGDDDERIRDVAASGLAALDDASATDALVTATKHASPRTRATATRALGQSSTTEARDALRDALVDSDPWVRYYACQAIGRSGDLAAADAVVALLDDSAGQVRVAAIDALARLRGERALDALHRAAASDDQDVVRAALLGLAVVRSPSSIPVLARAAHSEESATRLVALSALAEFDTPQALPLLAAAGVDADDGVRSAAINLLGARAGVDATQALLDLIQHPAIQERVVAALSRPVEGRVERLSDALRVATVETAPLVVSALARMRRAEAEAALVDAFAFDNVYTRRAIAAALGTLRPGPSRALLEAAAVGDADREVRHICLAALAP